MTINACNSGTRVWLADFEDANASSIKVTGDIYSPVVEELDRTLPS